MTNEEILIKYKSVVRELKKVSHLEELKKNGGCSLDTVQKIQKILLS